MADRGIYRLVTELTTEAARCWLVDHYLRTGELPQGNGPEGSWYVYPRVPDDLPVMRGKRVRVTFTMEEHDG